MKKKVTIIDDTLRRNVCHPLSAEMRMEYFKRFKKLPPDDFLVPVKNRRNQQIQETVRVKHVFKGEYLKHAVHRAKRWMRSGKFPGTGAPRHIAIFMAAFHKADPKGFEKLANATS